LDDEIPAPFALARSFAGEGARGPSSRSHFRVQAQTFLVVEQKHSSIQVYCFDFLS
jgi:hypothetical protein